MSDNVDAQTTPIVLQGMTWDHPRGVDGLRASDELVTELHGVRVEWEARSLLAFGDQLIGEFASDYDVMVIDHPHVPDAVHSDAIIPLDELLDAETLATLQRESVGGSHDSYLYRGRQWALAVDAAAQVSAFRPDLADGAAVYWDDVFEIARRGRMLWPYKPVDAFSTFATLLAQLGAPLAEPDRFLDGDAAAVALDTMIELAAVVPSWCKDANPIDVAEVLSTESDFSHAVALYGYTNYSRPGFRPHELAYDDIASYDGRATGATLGGAGVAVSSATKHPELAAAVAVTLAGAGAQVGSYTVGGGQPGNLRAWKSAALNDLTRNFFGNTLRTLEGAWIRPRRLGWPEMQLAMSHIVHDCLVERRVAPGAIDRLEALADLHLREPVA
ncbi:extracellular solute-binding protein [Microbacterium sulfonylureivorans]|uniref:extracellular solute-binding protein n=1 Tax=Microbacterium sulfonylureivorans TaxID=2486854 RepID=UPI000FDBDA8C|nr:extracellular solute-binding protein [Microbacterium sulfonylureivorans]